MFCLVLYGDPNEIQEEGVGVKHSALVFRMELCSYVPFESWYFHDLHKVALWVASNALHTSAFKIFLEVVVELVAVAVSLLYMLDRKSVV